jgi:hypothetical protein
MPIILATQEVKIRRIVVGSQPWTNSLWDPISKTPNRRKVWLSDSSGRVHAKEAWSLQCKPQCYATKIELFNLFVHSFIHSGTRDQTQGFVFAIQPLYLLVLFLFLVCFSDRVS